MDYTDFEIMFREALLRIETYPPCTVFLAKDPFEGTSWKMLQRGDKLGYGSFFKRKVALGEVPNVEYLGRADNNSAQYIKR